MRPALIFLALLNAVSAATTVGFLMKSRGGIYWQSVENAALAEGRSIGVDVIVKGGVSLGDPSIQMRLLNALIAQHVDAIVVSPSDPGRLLELVNQARGAGIKIVVIDTPEWRDIADAYVDIGREKMADDAAALLTSLVDPTAEVSMLRHSQSDLGVTAREKLVLEKLRQIGPQLVVHSDVFASAINGEEKEKAAFLLEKYPKTRGIMTMATQGTMAMIGVLQARKAGGAAAAIPFIGFGTNLTAAAARAIESGVMDAWIAQLPGDIGAKCVDAAVAAARGQLKERLVHAGYSIVTRKNLHDPAMQALIE